MSSFFILLHTKLMMQLQPSAEYSSDYLTNFTPLTIFNRLLRLWPNPQ
jgi:hypothetical protein